jgi:hypothetical protein
MDRMDTKTFDEYFAEVRSPWILNYKLYILKASTLNPKSLPLNP